MLPWPAVVSMGILNPSSRGILRWPGEILDRTFQPVPRRECRVLMAAYLFKGMPLAWECSECQKLFLRTLEELSTYPTQEVPDTIRTEFENHRCALHLLSPRMG